MAKREGKFCSSCNSLKNLELFAKDSRAKGGLQTKCKECSKDYYLKNRDRYRELKKKPSYKETQSAYQVKNRDSINNYKRLRYSTLEGKAKVKALYHERRAAKKSTSDGSVTPEFIMSLFTKQNYKCAITGDCIKEGYHIDHIIPLSKGGKHISKNIQLLTPRANMSKKDRIL